ncbi:MAG: BofC C-terminal domain-containing protein [Clostridia bacterium]|nr:BofC C-terminal domain-containing protein [Clostridia bacterium]
MRKETRAEERRRLMPVLIACVLLIGIAAWVSVLLPEEPKQEALPAERSAQQMLREWNGQLALFEGDGTEPAEVYEVTVAALPEEEQQRLREGIVIENEEMLASLLDNYTS